MKLTGYRAAHPVGGPSLKPGAPLWQVAPSRDQDGRPLIDFMMLLPGLRQKPQGSIDATFENIHWVLRRYREVVFADINLSINVLWVSLRHRPGLILEVAAAIKVRVPEALLVAQRMYP